jgi:hypothetical protein
MKKEIKSAASKNPDKLSGYHLEDLMQRIDFALNPSGRN